MEMVSSQSHSCLSKLERLPAVPDIGEEEEEEEFVDTDEDGLNIGQHVVSANGGLNMPVSKDDKTLPRETCSNFNWKTRIPSTVTLPGGHDTSNSNKSNQANKMDDKLTSRRSFSVSHVNNAEKTTPSLRTASPPPSAERAAVTSSSSSPPHPLPGLKEDASSPVGTTGTSNHLDNPRKDSATSRESSTGSLDNVSTTSSFRDFQILKSAMKKSYEESASRKRKLGIFHTVMRRVSIHRKESTPTGRIATFLFGTEDPATDMKEQNKEEVAKEEKTEQKGTG